MGREGRAADNWGAFFKPKRVEMILQVVSETERWGGAVLRRARGAPGDWAGVVTRVHALTRAGTSHSERSAAILVALTHHRAEASPTTTPRCGPQPTKRINHSAPPPRR